MLAVNYLHYALIFCKERDVNVSDRSSRNFVLCVMVETVENILSSHSITMSFITCYQGTISPCQTEISVIHVLLIGDNFEFKFTAHFKY